MDSANDDAKGVGYRRIEVLTGPGRRRQWSDDDKARIVAESAEPGAVVTEVARRWQVSPQQVFDWRRQARQALEATAAPTEPAFVPVVPEQPGPPAAAMPARPTASIEVKLAGAVLRVVPGTDVDLLTAVLRAIRVSAT
jgi:transposase